MPMKKHNAALAALGRAPQPEPTPIHEAPREMAKRYDKVMLYIPPKVSRFMRVLAAHRECKANDLYLEAIDRWLITEGYGGMQGVIDKPI